MSHLDQCITNDPRVPETPSVMTGRRCRSSRAVSRRSDRSWTCRRTTASRAGRISRWKGREEAADWQWNAYCSARTQRDFEAKSSTYGEMYRCHRIMISKLNVIEILLSFQLWNVKLISGCCKPLIAAYRTSSVTNLTEWLWISWEVWHSEVR